MDLAIARVRSLISCIPGRSGRFYLSFFLSAFFTTSGLVAAQPSISSKYSDLIGRHSHSLPVQGRPEAYSLAMQAISIRTGDKNIVARLPTGDAKLLEDAKKKTNNVAILPLFVRYAARISIELGRDHVDSYALGSLLTNAQLAERQHKSTVYREAVAEMTPRGKLLVDEMVQDTSAGMTYSVTDFAAMSLESPELVNDMASEFVRNVKRYEHQSSSYFQGYQFSAGHWEVIVK